MLTFEKILQFFNQTSLSTEDRNIVAVLLKEEDIDKLTTYQVKARLKNFLERVVFECVQSESSPSNPSPSFSSSPPPSSLSSPRPPPPAPPLLYRRGAVFRDNSFTKRVVEAAGPPRPPPPQDDGTDQLTLAQIEAMDDATADRLLAGLLEPHHQKCTVYRSMVDGARTQLVYRLLKPNQRVVFERLHQLVSSSLMRTSAFDGDIVAEPTSVCVDSPPGTGKSFLISALGLTLNFTPKVLVYQRALVWRLQQECPRLYDVETCCKFLMHALQLKYESAIRVFDDEDTLDRMLAKVYGLVRNFPCLFRLLILDEYTVVSPWFLVVLVTAAAVRGFNILCTGDKDQHNAIQESRFHNQQTNYSVIEHTVEHRLELETQVRITDESYSSIIREIKEKMNRHRSSSDSVPNTFADLYYLFTRLTQKFFVKERLLDVVYMSQFHRRLKQRQRSVMALLDKEKRPYVRAPFKVGDNHMNLVDLQVPDEHVKFLPYLLLVVGQKYVWYEESAPVVVTLLYADDDCVIVECGGGGGGLTLADGSQSRPPEQVVLSREAMTKYRHNNVATEHYEWLRSYAMSDIWQFPLRFYCSTYHAAQGMTLKDELVELDVDTTTVNSVYVGLSRVTRGSQVYALRTVHLGSLMYTYYKNDDYYYKIPNVPRRLYRRLLDFVSDGHSFEESEAFTPSGGGGGRTALPTFRVCTKTEFEQSKRSNLKVPRSAYDDAALETRPVTELVSVAKFFLGERDKLFGENPVSEENLASMYRHFVLRTGLRVVVVAPVRRKRGATGSRGGGGGGSRTRYGWKKAKRSGDDNDDDDDGGGGGGVATANATPGKDKTVATTTTITEAAAAVAAIGGGGGGREGGATDDTGGD